MSFSTKQEGLKRNAIKLVKGKSWFICSLYQAPCVYEHFEETFSWKIAKKSERERERESSINKLVKICFEEVDFPGKYVHWFCCKWYNKYLELYN